MTGAEGGLHPDGLLFSRFLPRVQLLRGLSVLVVYYFRIF